MVSEEEEDNDDTMADGVEGDDKGVWNDGEDEPPDDLRYNGEGKKNCCINREHAEDSFEASNHIISKVRSERCNIITQSKTQANPIDLSRTAHPQLQSTKFKTPVGRALSTRRESKKIARVKCVGCSCTANTKTGQCSATLVRK